MKLNIVVLQFKALYDTLVQLHNTLKECVINKVEPKKFIKMTSHFDITVEYSYKHKTQSAVSPPWPCLCISASLWAPAQPTSLPGSWWPHGCPSEGVPAAPRNGGVCRRGGRHSSAAVPVVHSSPPPPPLLCFHTVTGTPAPGYTALASGNRFINCY